MPTEIQAFENGYEDQRHSNTVDCETRPITENQRYRSTPTTGIVRRDAASSHNDDDSSQSSSDESDMGISSRNAQGSIKKMKKAGATPPKWKLNALRGSHYYVSRRTAFIPEVHCQLCKRRSISKALAKSYKKGHQRKCPNKPSNRGRLQKKGRHINPWQRRPQSSSASTDGAHDESEREAVPANLNQDENNGTPLTSIAYSRASYRRMGTLGLAPSLMPNWLHPELQAAGGDKNGESPPIDFAKLMRAAIDRIIESLGQPDSELASKFAWVKDAKAPAPVVCAVDLMLQQFAHRRRKSPDGVLPMTSEFEKQIERYYEFFPMHSCLFRFPTDSEGSVSPNYHQIEGETIMYLDWQLSFPKLRLPCPHCSDESSALVHDRTNWGKNRGTLFPIWNFDGSITWCVIMVYKCQQCKRNVDANDGRLLHLLPEHLSSIYPVLPKYAKNGGFDISNEDYTKNGGFHLHTDVSRFMESVFKTYGNGDMVSAHMVQSLGHRYTTKLSTYLSKAPTKPFVSAPDFINGFWPPSGHALRRAYESAEYSPLQLYGYSNYERNTRECQAVTAGPGDMVAYDWTFQTRQAYQNKDGLHCFFTGIVSGTKEVSHVLGTPSTKLADVSHGLIQSQKKRGMKPSVVSTDHAPWERVLGVIVWR